MQLVQHHQDVGGEALGGGVEAGARKALWGGGGFGGSEGVAGSEGLEGVGGFGGEQGGVVGDAGLG